MNKHETGQPQAPVDFQGRSKEFEVLQSAFKSSRSAFYPIYGRRRVGKSALILKFLEKHAGIYFLAKQASSALLIKEFLSVASREMNDPDLGRFRVSSWQEAFELVVDRWKGEGKLILALDEFQWLAESCPEITSVLQGLWDTQWQASNRIFLILCGSYIGFMEREVLGKKSPLFGRRTGQIKLNPFSFREAALFHKNYSLYEQARTWFVCGGIPLYLKSFSTELSVEQNIAQTFLQEHSIFNREADFLLREELREVENYYAILMALANGASNTKALAEFSGVGEKKLFFYLNTLSELGYVAKRLALPGTKPSPRSVRYGISDPLLKFWFRFVYPNVSFIAQWKPERTFKERVQPHIDSYFGTCFEKLCRESIPFLYEEEGIPLDAETGEYWDKNIQIDLVAKRSDGWIDLGECKWGKISPPAVEAELLRKADLYPSLPRQSLSLKIFTADPVKVPKDSQVKWYDLKKLYGKE